MSTFLVLGAGPVGSTVAEQLTAGRHRVVLATRSGSGPDLPGVERRVLDAADTDALTAAASGTDAVVNALNLPYARWVDEWPALNRSVLTAAERSGAVLCLVGSFYGYRAGTLPMTARTPLQPSTRKGAVRARMWEEIEAASDAGRVRALEVRASDYVGPQSLRTAGAHAGRRLVAPVLAGRRVRVVGDPDAPHTWTSVDDFARTVAALTLDERSWGRAWHAPSAPPRSIREVARDVARAAGAPEPRVSRLPRALLTLARPFDRQLGEVLELTYQFDHPFVDDSSETTDVFGLHATPWEQTVAATVTAARGEEVAGQERMTR